MKNKISILLSAMTLLSLAAPRVSAQAAPPAVPRAAAQNVYTQRFLDLRAKIYDPANGYFSPEGVPYHSVETLMVEAPDHGHETTSEAYSYWIWLDVMYGRVTGNWAPLNNAWTKMETYAIPTADQQPTNSGYNPSKPATYAAEHPLPSGYPSLLEAGVPVGRDPVSAELTSAYGANIYGMHWLFDCDNFYGYGNKGDGISKPSYINTFQRGPQESTWETIPHPSWENFRWGSTDGTGFLKLFIKDTGTPAAQWRYTNAPDADARVVQAIYWGIQFAREDGLNPATVLPISKASKMGDFVRLSMFDKYFRPIGVQNKTSPGGTGYDSAHYLISWYYAWGGPLVPQGWAWRIGSSHNHFGYQNPMAAYALSATPELKPATPNGARDWGKSLGRQLEMYQWLQSSEGAIAGGCTNSYNGDYQAYPANTPTFYGMAYDPNPVYLDPGSNTWFGFQAWSMERVAEYYYVTNDARAKTVLDKWISWVKTVVRLLPDGTFEIPSEISWTGAPNTWNPASPTPNAGLSVNIESYGKDLGIAAATAKTLIYYAAATKRWATLDDASRDLAKEILDRMWTNYFEPNGRGVAVVESRSDFKRFFEQEVYVPAGWSGVMANGDPIVPGVNFIDIRSKYLKDPDWPALVRAYDSGKPFEKAFHRFWAQADIALANAEYGRFFIDPPPDEDTLTVAPGSLSVAAAAGSSTVNVTSNLSWTAIGSQPWLTVAPASGSNNGVITVNTTANTAATARTGTVTVSGGSLTRTITVTQAGTPINVLTVAPTSLTLASAAGSSQVNVTANVSWTVTDNQTWLTVAPASGMGSGFFTVSATANTTRTARKGTVTVKGGGLTRTITVTQDAVSTSILTVAPTSLSLDAAAGSSTVNVTSNVSWTATGNQTWFTVAPASGTNNGVFTVSATANTATTTRTGTVTVSGGGVTRIITVTQAGENQTNILTVAPTSLSLAAAAGSSTVNVTANVSWTAVGDQTWFSVTPGSGTGNGALTVDVSANPGTTTRSGTITVAGGGLTRTITVTQTGSGGTEPTIVTIPFVKDGPGESLYFTTGNINYINSWNMQLVEINGVDLTNRWVSGASLPARVNGGYTIRYVGQFAWSHFEAK